MSLKTIKRNVRTAKSIRTFIVPAVPSRKSVFIAVEFESRVLVVWQQLETALSSVAYPASLSGVVNTRYGDFYDFHLRSAPDAGPTRAVLSIRDVVASVKHKC